MVEESVLLEEAYQRGCDYLMKYACAPGTFAAVMDTLGYEGDPDIEKCWTAAMGLVGGTGNMAIGTCGSVAGAAMAVSVSFGMARADAEDKMRMMQVLNVIGEVGALVQEKYGHISCQEIQFSLMGISYRLNHPKGMVAFMQASSEGPSCTELNGDIARWTVMKILEHNPGFSKRQ